MELNKFIESEKHYVTTRKMQNTDNYVRDYYIEDNHPTLKIARQCVKDYNNCFESLGTHPRDFNSKLEIIINKYKLKGSVYDSGRMSSEIIKLTIKRKKIKNE